MKKIIILLLVISPSIFASVNTDSLTYYKQKVFALETQIKAKHNFEESLTYQFEKKEAALKIEQEKKEEAALLERKKMLSIIYLFFAAFLCAVGFSVIILNKVRQTA